MRIPIDGRPFPTREFFCLLAQAFSNLLLLCLLFACYWPIVGGCSGRANFQLNSFVQSSDVFNPFVFLCLLFARKCSDLLFINIVCQEVF